MIRYLPFLIEVVLVVVALVDLVLIDASRVRGLPKWGWIMLAIILPIIGPILWFAVGRERLEARNHGRYATDGPVGGGPRSAPRAPDDDPEFLRRLSREQQQEQRIRDLERRLEERSADDRTPDSGTRDDRTPDDPKQAE